MDTLEFSTFTQITGHPLAVNIVENNANYPQHRHAFSELVIITKGSGIHLLGTERFPVSKGDIFTLQPQQTHGYEESLEMGLVNILFDRQISLPDSPDLRRLPGYHALFSLEPHYRPRNQLTACLHCNPSELKEALSLVHTIDRELLDDQPGGRTFAQASFQQLIVCLCRTYQGVHNPPSRQVMRIAEVVSWMEQHATEALPINDLARRAHMARSTFHRVFQEVYGRSPADYLIGLRLQRAKDLLQKTDWSITEIALRCGFNDSNYLSRQFRKQLGCTPSAYRKSCTPTRVGEVSR